jgi:NADH dehydrogenase
VAGKLIRPDLGPHVSRSQRVGCSNRTKTIIVVVMRPRASELIVVVGGGFAGFWAAVAARRVGSSRLSITVVSREPVLQIRPRLYEAEPQELGVDLLPLLGKVDVEFVRGEAATLDPALRTVSLREGDIVPYTRLVVATGSALWRPPVPGAGRAYSIDTKSDAIVFDRRLARIAETRARPVIAVVGCGFTGIELALELRDRLAAHGGEVQAERLRIVLIDRAPVVGRALGPGPRPVIESALARARVELVLGAPVMALTRDRVTLADRRVIDADAVVLTTGMVAAEFVRHLPGEHDELGRVVVDRTLRAPAIPDVFVAGDAAAADSGDGHRVLQSCQHALQLGRFAGENAARDLHGLPTINYVQPPYITCLDLGRSGAVLTRGWNRSVDSVGLEAKKLKHRINTEDIYPPATASREELLALSSLDPAEQSPARARRMSRSRSLSTRHPGAGLPGYTSSRPGGRA